MINKRLVPTLCIGLLSNYASAAGFQLLEQNASGLGNAYAGSAAVADNASTIFYNPAGMTQLQARELSIGLAAVGTSFKYSDQGSSVGQLAGTGNGGDAGGWGFIPNSYLSLAMSRDLYLGIGVGAPFGLKTEYANPWLGAAQSTMFDVKTYNVNPSIAYRVNDWLSVGAGLNWQRLSAEYTRQVAVAGPLAPPSRLYVDSPLRLKLDGDAWGWNLGALAGISSATKLGFSYRSTVEHELTGNIDVTGPSAAVNAGGTSSAKASLTLPDVAILSATHQLSEQWQLLGDLMWTGWSSLPKVDIHRTSGALSGQLAQTLDTDFRDAWRVALGANRQYNPLLKLKFGIAFDQTPVKGEATRLVSLPDNDRVWLSLGAQWLPSKDSSMDLGVAYLYIRDGRINNDQSAAGRGRVSGTYNNGAWILGGQYSVSF
jgi:long-chain fatty acid transport protein